MSIAELDSPEDETDRGSTTDFLMEIVGKTNVMESLEDVRINEIGMYARQGFDEDWASNAEWRKDLKEIQELAAQKVEAKTFPWPGASNVKYPLITTAALQFNARAYPALMNNNQIARVAVIGADPNGDKKKRGDRVAQFMSYQLLQGIPGWQEDMDKLLTMLPVEGCVFKKISYDDVQQRPVSYLCSALDVVVHNDTTNLREAPRISQPLALYPYEIEERVRAGLYVDPELQGNENESEQEPEEFIEQSTLIDLDEDGYPEPYVVTFVKDTGKVVRIAPNFRLDDIKLDENNNVIAIPPKQYFVKYDCFPNFTGGFYGIGFGHVLKAINHSVDSLLNMLVDAGSLSNAGGGFIGKGLRLAKGVIKVIPGKWLPVETSGMSVKDNVVPFPIKEPSNVLFMLLGALLDAAKEVSSTQDVMTGGGPQNAPVGTTMALIEQGMKVYSAIFKRCYLGLSAELQLLYEIDREHLTREEYERVLDEEADPETDFEISSKDIYPAADPAMSTDIQKAAKSQWLLQMQDWPGLDTNKIFVEAATSQGIDDPEQYLAPPPEGPTDAELKELAALKLVEEELKIKERNGQFSRLKDLTTALKNIAEADEKGADNVVNAQELALIQEQMSLVVKEISNVESNDDGTGVQRLEGGGDVVLPTPEGAP